MANANQPKGFRPAEDAKRESAYTAGGTIYPGDAVTMNSSGKVVAATASQSLIGVAAVYAAADGAEVMVWDDPDQKFVVQGNSGTTISQTFVGLNYNIVATGGNSTYRQSRMELDAASGATTSTLPLRLLGVSREVNTAIGENAKCVVQINAHQLGPNSAGL